MIEYRRKDFPMRSAIVLAAGKGTRMKSTLVKPMHKLLDKPMVEHIVNNLKRAGVERVVVVVGYDAEAITSYMQGQCEFATQLEVNGSGSAVRYASQLEGNGGVTLVVNGDCPLIQPETFEMMYREAENAELVVLSSVLEDGARYGRVIRDEKGDFVKITEFKDCNEEELKVTEINSGIYAFDNKLLFDYLPLLKNDNAQKEYYITDLIEIFKEHGHTVKAVPIADKDEASGINDRYELYFAQKWLQRKINYAWMRNGVTIIDPESTYISDDAVIGTDTIIYPETFIYGHSKIGKYNLISGGCYIENSVTGDHCTVTHADLIDSEMDDHKKIGPYLRIENNHISDSWHAVEG